MMRFLLLFSRQGRLRLQKWFTAMSEREKKKIIREMTTMVLARPPRTCNFLQWKDLKIVYKRYASLYFCLGVEDEENELLALEIIHRYVELLDKYFGNVFHSTFMKKFPFKLHIQCQPHILASLLSLLCTTPFASRTFHMGGVCTEDSL
ncbi:AP-1 complex subunit sigma-2 [Xenotaenia resolanae]|uniref:AP-1 complex subunit sigma-2 n=1 Tax=Xenotaenia resolanae TaxID=208358 RepID=A0ABV0WC94_9TELE